MNSGSLWLAFASMRVWKRERGKYAGETVYVWGSMEG